MASRGALEGKVIQNCCSKWVFCEWHFCHAIFLVDVDPDEDLGTPAGNFDVHWIGLRQNLQASLLYWMEQKTWFPVKIVPEKKSKLDTLLLTRDL